MYKRKPGRPKKDDEMRRDQKLMVRLRTVEIDMIKDAAKERGLSVSDFVRQALNEKM